MKRFVAGMAVVVTTVIGMAAPTQAIRFTPRPSTHPTETTVWSKGGFGEHRTAIKAYPEVIVSGCGDLQFITVYDARIGRSYSLGGKAWCGPSGYEWRVTVRCAPTLTAASNLTVKGPWTRSYYSVRQCPSYDPYATNIWFEKRQIL